MEMGGKQVIAFAFFLVLGAASLAAPSLLFVRPDSDYSRDYSAFLNVSIAGPVDTFKINWNGTNATVFGPSLLGAWNFNGNGNDWSGYGNTGARVDGNTSNADGNSPPVFTSGRFGQGLEFDGIDDYFNISAWTDAATELTIEAWVYKKSAKNQDIFTKKWDGDENGYRLWILGDDRLELQLRGIGNSTGYLRSNTALSNGTWHHVAGTYDGAEMRLYVDGILDSSKPFVDGIVANSYAPVVGAKISARAGDMSYVFNGTLDEVRVYSRAKPAGELNLTYNSELGRYYMNRTGLPEGVYPYYAWANDSTGWSQTPTKTLTMDRTPPFWLQIPQDQVVEYGSGLYYDLNASDNFGMLQYSVNDTRFRMDALNGSLENGTLLPVGKYGLNVSVNDSAGNALSGAFKVTVLDTTPPAWSQALQDQTLEYGTALSYKANATDPSGVGEYSVNDSARFKISALTGLLENGTGLALGAYNIKVSVNDTYGNVNSALFRLAVADTVLPQVSIQSPGSKNYTSASISLNYTAWDLSGISSCRYELNGAANVTIPSCQNVTIGFGDGPNLLRLWANDSAGNWNFAEVVFVVDTAPPTFSLEALNESAFNGSHSVKLTFGAADSYGISACWGELALEDGSRSNISGSLAGNSCTVVGTVTQVGDFSFKPYANDSHGNTGSGTAKNGVRVLLEWGQYQQDASRQTVAGGTAYITQLLKANNTLGSVGASGVRTEVRARAGWSCTEQLDFADIPAGSYLEILANNCSRSGVITKSGEPWYSTGATESMQNISRQANGTDTDPVVSYANVQWSTENESSPCWSSQQASGALGIAASGTWSVLANMSGDCISEGNWSNFGVYGTPTEQLQNITKSRAVTNQAGVAFYGVPWSTANDTHGCWNYQTPASGTYDLLTSITQEVNMSGDCVDEGSWSGPQVKGNPTVTGQTINATKTINSLDTGYNFTISWTHDPDPNACWTSGTTTGTYTLATTATIEANRTGDCIREENADHWRQNTANTTMVNGTAYITSNYTITNNANYQFNNLDLSNNITGRATWNCPEKITALSLGPLTTQKVQQAVNCTKEKVVVSVPGGSDDWVQDAGKTTSAGGLAYVIGDIKAANLDPLVNYTSVQFPADVGDQARDGWACTQAGRVVPSIGPSSQWSSSDYPVNCTKPGVVSKVEGVWSVRDASEVEQNITKQVNGLNFDGIVAFSNVYWDATNDTSPCWATQQTGGTFSISSLGSWHAEANMSGDCIAEGSWNPSPQVKGTPTVTLQTIFTNKTINSLDTGYNFTISWTHDPDPNACWTNGTTTGTYTLATTATIEANRTGDCIREENADHWRQNTANTTTVNGTAYITSNYTITNNANYQFNNIDLTQNITDRPGGWNCPEKITAADLPANTQLNWTQAINCSKENVLTKTLSFKKAYNASVLVGSALYAFYNFTVQNNDYVQYLGAFANYTGNIDHAEWANLTAEYEYLDLGGPAALGRIVNVTNVTVLEAWGGCVITQYGTYRKHNCTANLSVFEGELTRGLPVIYPIAVSRLYGWELRSQPMTTYIADGTSADIAGTEGTSEVNLTIGVSHSAGGSLSLGAHPVELVFYTVPPAVAYQPPTDNDSAMVNRNYTFVNASSDQYLSSCLLEWNGINESAIAAGKECSLNKTGIPDGWYSYKIWANNTVGNWRDTPLRTILIDTTPPIVNVSYPDGWRNVLNLTKSESDPESGIVECVLEYKNSTVTPQSFGNWVLAATYPAPCPQDYVLVSYLNSAVAVHNRSYQFRYSARNGAGSWSYANITNVTKLDTSLPYLSLSYPDGWVNDTLVIALAKSQGDDESGVEACVLQYKNLTLFNNTLVGDFASIGWANASSPDDCAAASFSGANGKAYKFRYNVKNYAGSWSGWTAGGETTKLDITPPEFVDVTYPEKWYNDTIRLVFALWGNDSQSGVQDCDLQYRNATMLNGAVKDGFWDPWAPVGAGGGDCGLGYFDGVQGGAYRFQYRVKNYAGLWSGFVANANAGKIDITPPDARIDYRAGWQLTTPIQLDATQSDNESGIVEYDIDMRSQPVSYGNIGNFDLIPWSGLSTSAPPYSYTGVNSYAYQFRYRVKNNAGSWSNFNMPGTPGYPGFVLLIDTTPPSVSLSYPNGWRTIYAVPITTAKDDPESNVTYCRLYYINATLTNGVPGPWASEWSNASGSYCSKTSWDAPAIDGQAYMLKFNVTNGAGNTNEGTSANIIYIDVSRPTAAISYPDGWQTAASISISTNGTDPQSGIVDCDLEYNMTRLDHGSFTVWNRTWGEVGSDGGDCPANGIKTFNAANGYAYKFRFRVKNGAGVWSDYANITNITKIDTTPPTISLDHNSGWRNFLPFAFTAKTEDDPESGLAFCNISFKNVTLAGNSPAPGWDSLPASPWVQTNGAEGDDCALTSFSTLNGVSIDGQGLKFRYNITNNAGLTSETAPPKEVWIDATAPSIDLFSYTNGWQTVLPIVVSRSQSDASSGISDCDLKFQSTTVSYGSIVLPWSAWMDVGAPGGDCGALSITGSNGRAYKFRYTVTDRAGLSTVLYSTDVLMIDTTAPVSLAFDFDNACYAPCWNGWRRSNPDVILSRSGSDPESGTDCDLQYQYASATAGTGSLNAYGGWQNAGGAAWGDCSDTFTAPNSGGYRFRYTIRNGAGTPAPEGYIDRSPKEIRLEFTPPAVTFSNPAWVNSTPTNVPLTHTQSDGESGIPSDPNGCSLSYKVAPLDGTYGNPASWSASWIPYYTTCGFTSFPGSDKYAYKFNFTVNDQAGLTANPAIAQWTGIDTTPPSPGPSISYTTGWKTDNLNLPVTWGGNDAQSGLDTCDLQYKSAKITKYVVGAWDASWQPAVACALGTNPLYFTAQNGYAYKFRFNVRNRASLWYGSYYEQGIPNEVYLDVSPPVVSFSYRTGWINNSGESNAFSLSHFEEDNESDLSSCILQVRTAPLNKGDGTSDIGSAAWSSVPGVTCAAFSNPYSYPLTDKTAYQFQYIVRNRNYNGVRPNTETVVTGGVTSVDWTNATGASISYPNGWLTTTAIPMARAGGDTQSGISDCDLEYQQAYLNWGLYNGLNDTEPWFEAGGSDGGDCSGPYAATNRYAYRFRYRLRNNAGLWTGYYYNRDGNVTKIDVTKPNTTATIDGLPPNTGLINGWYRAEKNLTLTQSDPESGTGITYYRIDNGAFVPYSQPFPILEDDHNYSFYSVNPAGLVEDVQKVHILKDTTHPSLRSVRYQPASVEQEIVGLDTPITVTANITDFAGVVFPEAKVCNMADCSGVVYCNMARNGDIWSCDIRTGGYSLGNYPFYVFAKDINEWTNVSSQRTFKVRRTEILLNSSSENPIDMQSTGTLIVYYRENDGSATAHIPKAACAVTGDFSGQMVDTGGYYAKMVAPVKLGGHTYSISCSKDNYKTLTWDITDGTPGKDLQLYMEFSPLYFDDEGRLTLQVGQPSKIKVSAVRISRWGAEAAVTGATAVTKRYVLTSTGGDLMEGNLTWDGGSGWWYADFVPDYGNYTATVEFLDTQGIGNSSALTIPTGGALELTTDAPGLAQFDVGSTHMARVFVENRGKKMRYYNLTLEGDLKIISLDGTPLSGRSVTLPESVANNTKKTHYVEIQGKYVNRQPQDLFVGVTNMQSARDSKNMTLRYQVTNAPVYGVRVAPDLDLLAFALLLLLGLARISRQK